MPFAESDPLFCSRCGTQLASTSAFCTACGGATGLGIDPAKAFKRPALVTLLAVLQFIGAAIFLPLGVIAVVTSVGGASAEDVMTQVIGVLWFFLGALNLACGVGLWTLKPYGRTLQIVLAFIGLFAIPIGTIISGLIVYYLWRPGIRALFSGKAPSEFTPAELAEVATVTQGSQAVTVVIVVFVLLGLVAMVGVIAAISVPALLRARMAGNEAVAIGSMRSILSAEAAYAASGGGGYAISLARLAVACPGMSQGFLTPDLAQDPSVKSGYSISLQSAGAPAGSNDCNGVPTESDFYATAVPVTPSVTGRRGFSTSATGAVFVDASGAAPSRAATLDGTATEVR